MLLEGEPQPELAVHPAVKLASVILAGTSSLKVMAGDAELNVGPRRLAKAKPVSALKE